MSVLPTTIHWYNDVDGRKVATADVGSYAKIPYGHQHQGKKYATDKPPHPQYGQWQIGLSCSPTSRTIVIDVDHPDKWVDSHTWAELGDLGAVANSVRQDAARAHVVVEVPEELLGLWPTQGPTEWGDVKSNGFSYLAGVHYTGMLYIETPNPWVVADANLLRAMQSDRIYPQGSAGANGATAGTWSDDEYRIVGDSQLAANLASMAWTDMTDEEIFARLDVILMPLAEPWTREDIQNKINSGRRLRAKKEAEEQEFWDGFFSVRGLGNSQAEAERREALREQIAVEHHEEREQVYATPELERPVLSLSYGSDQWMAEQARRLMPVLGYAYAMDTGAYFRRIGDHWERCAEDPCNSILALMADMVPRPTDTNFVPGAPIEASDPEAQDKKLYNYLHMSATSGKAASKLRAILPNSLPYIKETEMDTNGRVFWAGGTPYDLRTLDTAHVDPNAPHLLTAGYCPAEGSTPLWDELNAAQWPDEELREYSLNVLASVLVGGNKLLPNFKSDGNMGKTTRLMLLVDLLGTYAEQLPVQLLTGRTGHDESFLRLKGKRLVWMDETPPATKIATEKLKNLSGGGQLTGRAMFGRQSVTFAMQHTLILAGNDDLPLGDEAVYAIRVRYLPIIGDKTVIRTASRKIWDGQGGLSNDWKKEAPAVLWDMMQRASRIMIRSALTDMVELALIPFADAIIEQDYIAAFVRECCEPGGPTAAGLIREQYVAWCQRNAVPVENTTKFGLRLTKMGYPSDKHKATRDRPLKIRNELQNHW